MASINSGGFYAFGEGLLRSATAAKYMYFLSIIDW